MDKKIEDGGPAFPQAISNMQAMPVDALGGMTLRDYFAAQAPSPTEEDIAAQYRYDKMRNPYNDHHKPKLRDRHEIIADLAYRHADAMLKARA